MDFNKYSRNYEEKTQDATRISGQEQEFFVAAKANCLLQELHRVGLDPGTSSLLDVGCGVGLLELALDNQFASLTGVDVAEEALEVARSRNSGARFVGFDGETLPFPDGEFDVSVAVCVMHHVPPSQWREFIGEMARVTKPSGRVLVFEHNPFNPATRLIVSRCEYDADAVLLPCAKVQSLFRGAGLTRLKAQYLLFFPWSGRIWRSVERLLRRVPLGAQYMVAGSPLGTID